MILGSGAPHLEQGIRELAERYPQNIAVKIGYDEALSHLMNGWWQCDFSAKPFGALWLNPTLWFAIRHTATCS